MQAPWRRPEADTGAVSSPVAPRPGACNSAEFDPRGPPHSGERNRQAERRVLTETQSRG